MKWVATYARMEINMTNREFFENVMNGVMNDEMKEFAKLSLARLDKANSARREKTAEKAAEKAAERAPIMDAIRAAMTKEPKTLNTLIAETGVDITPQALTAMLRSAVEAGEFVRSEARVTGKGKRAAYALAE